jgi:uncharacterized protein YbaR (Trm112 family)
MIVPVSLSPQLLQVIVCPQCRQQLTAMPTQEAAVSLRCKGCGSEYPVLDGIPILLADRAKVI